MSIELHCHTLFSVDATGSPERVVEKAATAGVTALAITDHNHLGGIARGRARANALGIRFFSGIEFDAEWRGDTYHFLGIGFDENDSAVQELADQHTDLYVRRCKLILEAFGAMGYPISQQAIMASLSERYPSHPSPTLNQWHTRDLLIENGCFPDKQAFAQALDAAFEWIIAKHGESALGTFCSFETVRDAVQNAGGILLLAHVARYAPANLEAQIRLIHDLLASGLDGFELYHYSNQQDPHFQGLVKEADRLDCLLSGGSDCHNIPGEARPPLGSSPAPEVYADRIEEALSRRQSKV